MVWVFHLSEEVLITAGREGDPAPKSYFSVGFLLLFWRPIFAGQVPKETDSDSKIDMQVAY